MERNELRSAAPAVCSVNNFLCILTPFFHSLFAPLILFPSYTHAHMIFSGFIILSCPSYCLPEATCHCDPPSGQGAADDRFPVKEPPSSWDGHLRSALEMPGCFPAALASPLALSTAVVAQKAARRRQSTVQPDTEESGAVSHLFSPLGGRL